MARRIHKAKIKFLSLVPRGANRMQTILKSDDSATFEVDFITKAFDKTKGELTAVVYAPEQRDSHGDIASAEVIKDALYNSMREGIEIDLRHNEVPLTKSQAFIAEHFIVQKGDPRFSEMKDYSGNVLGDKIAGSWGVIIKIEDPTLKAKYESGEFNGLSMAGSALVETEKSDNPSDGDLTMTAAELKKMLDDNNAALATTIQKTVDDSLAARGIEKKVEAKPGDKIEKDENAPVLAANATTAEIRKHGLLLRRYNITKTLDGIAADEVKFEKACKDIEALDTKIAEIEKAAKPGTNDGASNQPLDEPIEKEEGDEIDDNKVTKVKSGKGGAFIGLAKSTDDHAALAGTGSRMASFINAKSK